VTPGSMLSNHRPPGTPARRLRVVERGRKVRSRLALDQGVNMPSIAFRRVSRIGAGQTVSVNETLTTQG
jgi:hypothetical protein